ncbi:hypothetical protein [Streptomyces sp. NPDC008125]|uniref:hypothetical protein n=1 Tax=Streptomyces sp. NPDC008125 TaxID=3364811 RepID=UPI0036EC8811
MVPLSSRERQILAQLEASLARDFPDDPAVQFGRDVEGEHEGGGGRGAGGERDLLKKAPGEGPGTAPGRGSPRGGVPGEDAGNAHREPLGAPSAADAPGGRTGIPGTRAPYRPGRFGRLIRSRRTFAVLAVVSFVLLGAGMITGNLWVVVAFVVTWSATFLVGAARMLSWSRRQGY